MSRKAQAAVPLNRRMRFANRARLLEEASHGITRLLRDSGKSQAWLARRLEVSPPLISKILEGSHNFTLETLADVVLAFDHRAVHLVWGDDHNEMRFPKDEKKADESNTSLLLFAAKSPRLRLVRAPQPVPAFGELEVA